MAIILHDVGIRDGLQIEQAVVPTDRKIAWIERLIASGVDAVQVGSFVSPKAVPQMADTDAIVRHFSEQPPVRAVRLTTLVLNEKGLERGLAAGARDFCLGVSASDTHSRKNTGMDTAEATARIVATAQAAVAAGARVQVSVQSAFGCGFEGIVPIERVLGLVRTFVDAGFERLSLADTAGHATPPQVERLFDALRRHAPAAGCACHFHDTYGLALANAWAAIRAGVDSYEAAFGGLGGCPFTAVAAGNLCTEDFLHSLQRNGLRADVSLAALLELANDAERFFGRTLPGVIHRTGPIPGEAPAGPASGHGARR